MWEEDVVISSGGGGEDDDDDGGGEEGGKSRISMVVIGHVDAGKSTLMGQVGR